MSPRADELVRLLRGDRGDELVRLLGVRTAQETPIRASSQVVAWVRLLELCGARPAWHAQAACRGQGSLKFFPGRGGSAGAGQAVCGGCAVVSECLAYGRGHGCCGVWGGEVLGVPVASVIATEGVEESELC